MQKAPRLPSSTATVIIRDDSPMIFCGDSPSYRSVRIALAEERRMQIKLLWRGRNGATDLYEEISRVFIEPKPPEGMG